MYAVGTLLAGKYRIDRVLGQGGMGLVVAATHVQLNQPVALKFLLDDMLGRPQIVERFLREARASAALRSEHVCRVSDVGTLDNGAPYIVMELLRGRDLSTFLAGNSVLPVGLVADYVQQACLGLAEAHAQGIIHRDLKPANLFLTQRPDGSPVIKILDFGIAKAHGDNMKLTRTAAVIGSPGYMSPEQLRSARDVDVRSDIWSLGVILYELVSGHPPFQADSLTEMALRVAMDPTPPLTGRPLPAGFDAVVYRCLEKDPNYRFQDVAQLARVLAPYAGPRGNDTAHAVARVLCVTDQPVQPAAQSSGTPTTLSAAAGAVSKPRRRGAAAWIAAVGGMTIVGGMTAFVLHGTRSNGAASQPPAVITPILTPTRPAITPPAPSTAAVTALGLATTAAGSGRELGGAGSATAFGSAAVRPAPTSSAASLALPSTSATAANVHEHSPPISARPSGSSSPITSPRPASSATRDGTHRAKSTAPSKPIERWDNSRY